MIMPSVRKWLTVPIVEIKNREASCLLSMQKSASCLTPLMWGSNEARSQLKLTGHWLSAIRSVTVNHAGRQCS